MYKLSDAPVGGIDDAPAAPILRFVDTPEPFELESAAYRILALCDGYRNYGDIAAILDTDTPKVLEIGAELRRTGLVDHLRAGGHSSGWRD